MAKTAEAIHVQQVKLERIKVRIIGTTPLFQNRMSAKVKQQLLVGSKRKTAADKASIKHNPLQEYQDSAETLADGPTALGMRVVAIKSAMCDAAIETAGLTKAGTQRLIFMPGDHVALYGTPQLRMDVVRSADMNKTPDVRSRAYLPKWGCEVEIQYVRPQLSASAIVTLLVNAGVLIGLGDYRQQKGKGAFGSFRVIGEGQKDAEWDDLVKHHGRMKQLAALAKPKLADDETADLMSFYEDERTRRSA